MTTRSRVRWARAAALSTLAGGALAVPAAPATAAPETVSILSVSAENVKPRETVRVQFRVTNSGRRAETAIVVVGGGLRCTAGCRAEPKLGPGQSQTFDATLVAPEARPGETTGLNISIGVRLAGQNSYAYKMVYVHGPGASPTGGAAPAAGVSGVSGRVRDAEGKAIGGADLTIRDSAGHEYRTTSNRSGQFSITSRAGRTIAEGSITVRASMDGYRTARATVRGRAGDVATVRLTLSAVASPTTTPPSPTAEASPLAAAAEDAVPGTTPPTFTAASDEGGSTSMFLLGGLLVAAGLGALALVLVRRRNAPSAVAEAAAPPAAWLPAPPAGSMADAPTAILHTGPAAGGSPHSYSPHSYGTSPQGGGHQHGYRG
ncbi:carboxypeptidase regulatory-like domain-containing protein [Micromonospora sp. AMSO1212t]|uniref:carboxypeptidase-like regulatory domain-containing protein n=1 Tax=Micromonospora TaxID=1873 RepID=UPI00124B5C08|nr:MULTISPECIES: carboxypeptidase-like regulatory domain-containing protein [Micromonospora]KAB1908237.1 carboxypeptidase regulatory-like domain-containing protein [Micromonospora sp. AMSO1212t]MDX5461538.1 carboxypeptidase-like regulatory domain-containing protein [Micromonospora tulbaghiae]